ncbi:myotubularin, putative [Entamoeba invadens IP1]|uniref:Myotubularin, putative n=1 Tax=Entamoeba invadens IP1 TaxID=370355 RepID=A0A0A1UAQ3_ENTIV|nr:myotubularin, putative [Entamoeba invadens IP1]ELP89228.1 myotubularin, putative [Entamoeba invadens IP1]|eukprot:XP_004255999.1 myotubularin, putative [Entamoeba invadens IP1]
MDSNQLFQNAPHFQTPTHSPSILSAQHNKFTQGVQNTPPSPVVPLSPTPPTYDQFYMTPRRSHNLVTSLTDVLINDLETCSYTSSNVQAPTISVSNTEYSGDTFRLSVSQGKLVIRVIESPQSCSCVERRVPLGSIKDIICSDGVWRVKTKYNEVISIGRGEGVREWFRCGLRGWDLDGGLEDGEGCTAYDTDAFYLKCGVLEYTVRNYNEGFDLCATYPRTFVLPSTVTREMIFESSQVRYLNRFPFIVYVNTNGTALWRAAAVIRGKTDALFRKMGKSVQIFELTGKDGIAPSTQKIEEDYTIYISQIQDTENIKRNVERSGWLRMISKVITISNHIRYLLQKGETIEIESEEGKGVVSVVSSVVLFLIDSHYRTIKGVVEVIEKEWSKVGYSFGERNGKGVEFGKEAIEFVLMMQSLYTLLKQNPSGFEINENGLDVIMALLYSGAVTTFMYDCDKDCRTICGNKKTLYDDIKTKGSITNEFFDVNSVLSVSGEMLTIPLWTGYYLKYSHPDIARLRLC